jgi:hypothetical protein
MEKTLDLNIYKKMVLTMGLIVASILLPQVFHSFGMAGPIFLPMHIPVLLTGYLLGPKCGIVAGMLSPIISTYLTGMPAQFPMMPIMVFELGTYGFVSGLLSKHTKLPSLVNLFITMIAGRISYAIIYTAIKTFLLPTISENISAWGAFVTGLPGIAIQLIVVTLVIAIMKKRGISDDR